MWNTYRNRHVGLGWPLLPGHKQVFDFHLFLHFCRHKHSISIFHAEAVGALNRNEFTSPLSSFDLQQLPAVSGHHIPIHQGPDGAHVPQSLVKRKQLGWEVKRSEGSSRTSQPALLLAGQRRNRTTQQCIRLHGGTKERVGILEEKKGRKPKTKWTDQN